MIHFSEDQGYQGIVHPAHGREKEIPKIDPEISEKRYFSHPIAFRGKFIELCLVRRNEGEKMTMFMWWGPEIDNLLKIGGLQWKKLK